MADILGNILVTIIIIGAIGYGLFKVYQFLKNEGLIGGKKMGMFDKEQKPEWEESKNYALHRGVMGLDQLDKKLSEGWGLAGTPTLNNEIYYYFMRVR